MHRNQPVPYSVNDEQVPSDEEADIQKVVDAVKAVMAKNHETSGKYQGEVHVKTHAYVKGELRVLPNLPAELAQGIFSTTETYPTTTRFSNSAGRVQTDALPDGRGMAIKVFRPNTSSGPPHDPVEHVQDFLMINHPVFFAATVKDYLRVQQALSKQGRDAFSKLAEFVSAGEKNPLRWRWRELLTALRIFVKVPSPLGNTAYFSMVPFRFGNFVAKYRVRPAASQHTSFTDLLAKLGQQADAFRLALEDVLSRQELLFEFQVQLRTNTSSMPIENAAVEWSENESPFRTVAHLLLPRQEIASLRAQPDFQKLAFNVWNCQDEHRPLGGINRSRRAVYPVSYDWRSRGSN